MRTVRFSGHLGRDVSAQGVFAQEGMVVSAQGVSS